ncbi:MAG: DUF4340 domain-containing protein [Proteobacteria bacterium]|nr:DUF4340 domain-containing protein [Pseudomonadota bacterium]
MTPRRVVIALIAAIAVIALSLWLSSQRHLERSTAAASLVLPGLAARLGGVTEVDVRKGDGTRATLKATAGSWQVAQRDWPADTGRVRKLLLDLAALNVVEEKTSLPANYPQLGVEDVSSPRAGGTLVTLTAGARQWSVIIGKAGSGRDGYVRVPTAATSLLAAPLLSVDADPKSWLQTALLDVPSRQLRQIRVQPAGKPAWSATRDKPGATFTVSPLPKGRVLSGPSAVDASAEALSALTLDDVQPAPPAPPAPLQTAHSSFNTFDGLTIEVSGRQDGTRTWVTFTVSSAAPASAAQARTLSQRLQGREFAIAGYRYDSMFRALEELLQPLPQPTKKQPPKH